jgi:thiamine-phosphate pyrophosphorylase
VRVHAVVADLGTAKRAVEAGATVVQLRVKASTPEVVARGDGFRELGADGVHLGQCDHGAERARDAGLLLGRSVATLEQALAADGDYLGAGPVWATPSKADADSPIGLHGLRLVCEAVSVPVVAIGGIDAANAADCIRAGAFGVACIRAATDPALRRAVDAAFEDR